MEHPAMLKDTEKHTSLCLVPNGDEAHFSHLPCRCCWSGLGGDRYDCTVLGHNKKTGRTDVIDEVSICTDCLFAHCEI